MFTVYAIHHVVTGRLLYVGCTKQSPAIRLARHLGETGFGLKDRRPDESVVRKMEAYRIGDIAPSPSVHKRMIFGRVCLGLEDVSLRTIARLMDAGAAAAIEQLAITLKMPLCNTQRKRAYKGTYRTD